MRVRGLHGGGPPVHLFAGAATLLTVVSPGRADPFTAPIADAIELRHSPPDAGRVKLTGTVLDSRYGIAWLRSTVKKHLERVFEKLGVENRGAASLRVLEVLGR